MVAHGGLSKSPLAPGGRAEGPEGPAVVGTVHLLSHHAGWGEVPRWDHWPWRTSAFSLHHDKMVSAATTKRVLEILAGVLPEEGDDLVTGLRIHEGWGATMQVAVHTALSPATPSWHALAGRISDEMASVVTRRHQVRLVWDPGPTATRSL